MGALLYRAFVTTASLLSEERSSARLLFWRRDYLETDVAADEKTLRTRVKRLSEHIAEREEFYLCRGSLKEMGGGGASWITTIRLGNGI
jgi:hypothetical protein